MIIQFSNFESILIYTICFLFTSLIFNYFAKNNKKYMAFISLIPVTIVFAIRYCGTDIKTYEQVITRISTVSWQDIFTITALYSEFGFQLITKLFFSLGGFALVNFVIGILIVFPVYYVIFQYRKKLNVFLASFIFLFNFFLVSFNIMRQFIAISFVSLAIYYLLKNKNKQFFIYIFIGFLFHKTAVIGLLIYIIYNITKLKKNTRENLLKILILVILGVLGLIVIYISIVTDSYGRYLDSSEANNRDFYVIIMKFFIIYSLRNHLFKLDKNNKFYYILLIMTIPLGLTGFFNPYIKRLYYFFNISECFLFSQLQNCFKDKLLIKSIIMIMYYGLFILTFVILLQGEVIPYGIKI